MTDQKTILDLAEDFKSCQNILTALGDESRLQIILTMLQMGNCSGARVGEITEKVHLSRPAVSHHLQILKNAGILRVRKEATKNYYYFDENQKSMKQLIAALRKAVNIASSLPDRSGEND